MVADREIRLLLVDDHEMVRVGLKSMLVHSPRMKVVGEAGTVKAAVQEAVRLKPDLVLMDVRLPDGSGVEVCREIRSACPDTRVLFLTSFADEDAVFAAVFGCADGYLIKQVNGDMLINAIQTVADGKSYLDPAVTGPILSRMRMLSNQIEETQEGLSAQEQRVLALVAEGRTNKEIANELGLSSKTVKNYLSNIFQKLQISRRTQAAAFYSRHLSFRLPR